METDHLNKIKNLEDIEDEKKTTNETPDEPFKKFCTHCHKEVTTFVNKEAHPVCFIIVIFLLYFYGLYSIPAIAILAPLLRTLSHLCPYCQTLLIKKNYYPVKQKDNVI